jgi:aldehyde dehydrogenase (NAD+)
MAAEPKSLPIQIRHADRLYIDGSWVAPKKSQRIEIVSPYNEQVTAVVAGAGPADMDLAVAAARKAFDSGPWPRLTHAQRAGYLMKLADELEKRIPELARCWTEQVGALQSGAPGMIGFVTSMVRYFAGLADKFPFVETVQTVDGKGAARVVREPVGVVAAISPWNAPYMIMIQKIAPALLAGCTVIMKPAPETPLEAYIIAESAEAAGFPPGVLNLVPADREASDHLICNAGIDKVSFTGSTAVGKRIGAVCGGRIGRVGLELGGKSAAICLDDYDVGTAAKALANTIAIMCGQVCATLSRAVVPRAKHDQYAEAIAAELKALRVGDPYDPKSQMGPLAMKRQLARVEGYMDKGRAEGAQLVCGGKRASSPARGFYFEPTLFARASNRMTIAQEEIFGPVITLIPYEDEADALRIANDSTYGLFGAVFTNDNDRAWRIARGVRTGWMSQNGFRMDWFLPFGGFKQSGIGREGGTAGVASYTEVKTVLLDGPPSS